MSLITINLLTGRTIEQGVSMEAGKEKERYTAACGIIELNADDLKRLGIMKNTNVRVSSNFGNVIVKAIEARQKLNPGEAYIPMGPWANSVVSDKTYSTGMPTFKGTPITIEAAPFEPVLSSVALIRSKVFGG
jgi:formylmethanofuran dehydrogenase subunit D